MNNKQRRTFFLIQILTGLAFAVAGPSAGYGQAAAQPSLAAAASPAPSEEEIVRLPKFSVTATPADPYNATEAASAARTAGKILDIPITAYIITPALIQNISPNQIFDVTNYFAGVSTSRGVVQNDRATFRGFENYSRTVDNLSQTMIPYMFANFNNFPPVFVDHTELIMGPDAILSPTGTPGGTLSLITKSPQFIQGTDVSATVGNYMANKVTVDSTGPLGDGKHMAYRVIAAYQDSRTYLPGSEIAWAGAAEFTYKFSDTAKFTVKYFGIQQRYGGAAGANASNGEEVFTPGTVGGVTLSDTPEPGFTYDGWNGVSTWSELMTRENTAAAELTAALGERINMRLAAQVDYSSFNYLFAHLNPTLTEKWDPNTGQEISVTPINPTAMPELAAIHPIMSRQIQVQNDYAGNFNVGRVSLQPVVGWAYQQASMPVFYTLQDKNMPTYDLASGIYSPPVPPKSAFTSLSSNTPMSGWTMQAYGYLRAGFLNDRLFVTGGVARTWAGVVEYSIPYVNQDGYLAGTVGGPITMNTFSNTHNSLAPSVQPWHDAYLAGILYKALPNVSVYYNYSTNATLASAIPLWQAGVQNEFGIKSNFFNDRISVTADHFEIKQNNLSFQNPLFALGQSTTAFLYTDEASHGEELNIAGGITKNLSVVMSYTNQKLRDAYGRRVRNIPDTMANLLLDYNFNKGAFGLKKSDVFVGVNHQGDVAGEAVTAFTPLGVPEQPGFYLAAYSVVHAGASCQLGNYRFNLNVDNVLNKRFWWQAQSRASIQPYPGLTVTFTATVHFR
jgi:iron complex outermembrane receptor protein